MMGYNGSKYKLWLTVTERPDCYGYHFCVSGCHAITAYRTAKGFKAYLQRTGLTLEFIREGIDRNGGWYKNYELHGEYNDIGFLSIEEVPKSAKVFKGLSNGSYVDCYYAVIDGIHTILRPNPNYKDIYKPVSMEEHQYLSSIN